MLCCDMKNYKLQSTSTDKCEKLNTAITALHSTLCSAQQKQRCKRLQSTENVV